MKHFQNSDGLSAPATTRAAAVHAGMYIHRLICFKIWHSLGNVDTHVTGVLPKLA
jgi:hypothetical protein